MFSNIFNKKKTSALVDFSVISTDVHSHLIQGLDDGSTSIEESIQIIKALVTLGYKKIIATPHVQSDFYKNTNATIMMGCATLKEAITKENIPLTLDAAAEYFIDYDFEQKIHQHDLLTIGKNFVLVELSYMMPPDNLNSVIFEMTLEGYKVILAHPERYTYWHKDLVKYEELKDREVYFQTNILSLSEHYSAAVRKTAQHLIDKGMVNFIGTDIHNINAIELIQHTVTDKYFEKLVNSGKLMNSQF